MTAVKYSSKEAAAMLTPNLKGNITEVQFTLGKR